MFKLGTFDEAICYKIKERGFRSHLAQSARFAGEETEACREGK